MTATFKLKALIPTEHQECTCLVEWAAHKRLGALRVKDFLIAIPNGAVLAGDPAMRAKQMNKMKAAGLRPGTYDYFLAYVIPPHGGLWLEMKRLKGGIVSHEQEQFGALMDIAGYKTAIAVGWEQGKREIENYLSGKP